MPKPIEPPQWRTSARSSGGSCVQVKKGPDRILVRDSKDPNGAVLTFDYAPFQEFLDGIRDGEFDRP